MSGKIINDVHHQELPLGYVQVVSGRICISQYGHVNGSTAYNSVALWFDAADARALAAALIEAADHAERVSVAEEAA
jgi:hypothetical protein